MPTRAKVTNSGPWWTANGKRFWRLGADYGGPPGVFMRDGSEGPGRLLRRAHPTEQALPAYVWATWEPLIRDAAHATGVDMRTIVACICTESGGKYNAERFEPHLNDRSMGLMQTLTQTARHIGMQLGYPGTVASGDESAESYRLPTASLTQSSDVGACNDWRRFLYEPRNSILIGAATLAELDKRYGLNGDPVLLAASYNSGGPYVDDANSWGLRQHGPHVDCFAGFWTLAAEVMA